jgi:hypothetical protein
MSQVGKTIPRLEQLREIEGPPPLEVPRKDIFMFRAMTIESKICIRSCIHVKGN